MAKVTDAQMIDPAYYNKIVEDAEGKDFWTRQQEEGWGSIQDRHVKAQQAGREAAAGFMAKVNDRTAPGHDRAMSAFRDQYGLNEDAVYKDYSQMMASSVPPLQHKDSSYENRALSGFRIATSYDSRVLSNYMDLMRAKWRAVGYSDDPKVRALYFEKYPISNGPVGPDPAPPSGLVSGGYYGGNSGGNAGGNTEGNRR